MYHLLETCVSADARKGLLKVVDTCASKEIMAKRYLKRRIGNGMRPITLHILDGATGELVTDWIIEKFLVEED